MRGGEPEEGLCQLYVARVRAYMTLGKTARVEADNKKKFLKILSVASESFA